ncbi:hypothetical protein DFJ74DRAFT_677966 [Hyaloraphidium curvatum]|nr:hypothetical protein DFJ74DRAFT_677966 [Hyaloraphidium curvatum]
MPPKKKTKAAAAKTGKRGGKPHVLTADEELSRTIELLPRKRLNQLIYDSAKNGTAVSPDELRVTLTSVISKSLTQFPVEILVAIFQNLGLRDRLLCLRTCRYFRELGQTQPEIWRSLVLVKVQKPRNKPDPNAWLTKTTLGSVAESIVKNSLRSLVVDDDVVHMTTMKVQTLACGACRSSSNAVVEKKVLKTQQHIEDLTLMGKDFIHYGFIDRLQFPHLKALRIQNARLYSGWRHRVDASPLASIITAHPRVTTLMLEADNVQKLFDIGRGSAFSSIKKLCVTGRVSTILLLRLLGVAPSVEHLCLGNVTMNAEQAQDPRFRTRKEIVAAGDSDGEAKKVAVVTNNAAPLDRKIRSLGIHSLESSICKWDRETGKTIDTPPLALLGLISSTIGPTLERITVEETGSKLSLHGDFPGLKVLRIGQRGGEGTPPFALFPGSTGDVFAGFNAPGLEKITVIGKGELGAEEVQAAVGERVRVEFTGKSVRSSDWSSGWERFM